jgi:hypothetical protein
MISLGLEHEPQALKGKSIFFKVFIVLLIAPITGLACIALFLHSMLKAPND